MLSWLRTGTFYLLISYLLLSAVPFAALLFPGQSVDHPLRLLCMEVAVWTTAWVLCKRPAWFHLLLLPAFFALPIELYLRAFYGQSISSHHLGILVETSPKEAFEFLGAKIWLLLCIVIGIAVWWWTIWMAAWSTRVLDWKGKSRWITGVVLVAGAGIWSYGQQFGVQQASAAPASASASAPGSASVAASDAAAGFSTTCRLGTVIPVILTRVYFWRCPV